jgi:hypothetical protein
MLENGRAQYNELPKGGGSLSNQSGPPKKTASFVF